MSQCENNLLKYDDTLDYVNGTVSISTNERFLNQYPCTRSIFNS